MFQEHTYSSVTVLSLQPSWCQQKLWDRRASSHKWQDIRQTQKTWSIWGTWPGLLDIFVSKFLHVFPPSLHLQTVCLPREPIINVASLLLGNSTLTDDGLCKFFFLLWYRVLLCCSGEAPILDHPISSSQIGAGITGACHDDQLTNQVLYVTLESPLLTTSVCPALWSLLRIRGCLITNWMWVNWCEVQGYFSLIPGKIQIKGVFIPFLMIIWKNHGNDIWKQEFALPDLFLVQCFSGAGTAKVGRTNASLHIRNSAWRFTHPISLDHFLSNIKGVGECRTDLFRVLSNSGFSIN